MKDRRSPAAGFAHGLLVVCVGILVAAGLGPRTGRYQVLTVLSGSMRPAIPAGALVVVVPEHPSAVRRGQVITFQAPVDGRPVVTHRVVAVARTAASTVIRTKGDANAHPDPWTARLTSRQAWRVALVLPHAGDALQWLRTPDVRHATLLVIPAIVVLLWLSWIWGPRPAQPVWEWRVAATVPQPRVARAPQTGEVWEPHALPRAA